MLPRLQAEEMVRFIHAWRLATGVGVVESRASEHIVRAYNTYVEGLEAVRLGAPPDPHAGKTILRSSQDIRDWFWREGRLRV